MPFNESFDLVCFGGGAHFKSVASVLARIEGINVSVLIDPKVEPVPAPFATIKMATDYKDILLGDIEAASCSDDKKRFLVTFGGIAAGSKRESIFNQASRYLQATSAIFAQSAVVDSTTDVSAGTMIMEHVYLGPLCRIHENVLINTGAIIEHDTNICAHAHVATGAIVNGGVLIGSRSFVGSGAVVFQNETLPPDTVVPAGCTFRNGRVCGKDSRYR